ncbi:FAD-dependent oxidoreductase [Sphingomonas sp. Root720]|uniref:FAD-dependent oxidoreductase n=1 Tax=Sphingomonas sp. Root720 TaxID=1736595 RepID=UPI001F2B005B|nr:FAD-dependent oxidoreductase [Sphingomonas sp. Root720]
MAWSLSPDLAGGLSAGCAPPGPPNKRRPHRGVAEGNPKNRGGAGSREAATRPGFRGCGRLAAAHVPHPSGGEARRRRVTTAYALLDRGHTVTVVDRHRYPAMETSFANGGQLSASNAEVWNSWRRS